MDELESAIHHLLKARELLENGGDCKVELWFARSKIEVFLAKLSLKHGLEEVATPRIKGKVNLNLEVVDELVKELGSAAESYCSGDFEGAFKTGWNVREKLT
ncbi:MAG: hypothetical protein QXS15_05880, partial [Candidatus Jordarchaeales archaeon]